MALKPWPYGRTWRRIRRSSIAWWAITIALGLITASVVGSSIGRATQAAQAWGTNASVWIVRHVVDAGDVITARDVQLTHRPRGVVPEGALDGAASPVGEATRIALVVGEIVLTERLAGHGTSGVAAMVAPGYRAIAIPAADALPRIAPGDRVDVLATFDVGDAEGGVATTEPSFAVASDAEVLAVSSQAITVAVEARHAARVAFALAKAAVTLVVRGPSASDVDADDGNTSDYSIRDEGHE